MTDVTPTTLPSAPARSIHRIWPGAVIAFGLAATAAWMCLLGYGIVRIIGFAF